MKEVLSVSAKTTSSFKVMWLSDYDMAAPGFVDGVLFALTKNRKKKATWTIGYLHFILICTETVTNSLSKNRRIIISGGLGFFIRLQYLLFVNIH